MEILGQLLTRAKLNRLLVLVYRENISRLERLVKLFGYRNKLPSSRVSLER
jgi:hypothetical protein